MDGEPNSWMNGVFKDEIMGLELTSLLLPPKGDLYEYTYFSIGHCYHLIWFISVFKQMSALILAPLVTSFVIICSGMPILDRF